MSYSKEALRKEKEKKEAEIKRLLGRVARGAYGALKGDATQADLEEVFPDDDGDFGWVSNEDAIQARARLREIGMTDNQIDTGAGEIIQAEGYTPFSAGSKKVAESVGFASGLTERRSERQPGQAVRFKPEDPEW